MPQIAVIATALPPHRFTQTQIKEAMAGVCRGNRKMERLLPVFDRTGVDHRAFARPLEWYAGGQTFEARNDAYAECAFDLIEEATSTCLERAQVDPIDVDHIFCVTTTGLTTPSLEFSPTAESATDLIGVALFGDGGAAVLMTGDEVEADGPRVADTRTHLFHEAPDLMGWRFTDDGMRLVLSRGVPEFVATTVKPVVEQFLAQQGLTVAELQHHVLHPGGAKVMSTYRSAFGLDEHALRHARGAMRNYGNQSSASVLFMLHDLIASGLPARGDRGVLMALGPGFAAEMLTLAW
jgi:alkylresorcinol/alkylpyrone synthase